jgi:hypothetical protein
LDGVSYYVELEEEEGGNLILFRPPRSGRGSKSTDAYHGLLNDQIEAGHAMQRLVMAARTKSEERGHVCEMKILVDNSLFEAVGKSSKKSPAWS